MLYAILCYDSEAVVGSWTKEQDAAVIAKLDVVQDKLRKEGRLGPVARLMPTTAATTIRKGKETLVLDGPFAETKEQLLGFYIVDCASLACRRDGQGARRGPAARTARSRCGRCASSARERWPRDRRRLGRRRPAWRPSSGGRHFSEILP